MATTRGQGPSEEEPTREERVQMAVNEAIAGQGIVRRVVLYVLAFALCVSPAPYLAVVPIALLMATDGGLA